jgi:hypothetical protein
MIGHLIEIQPWFTEHSEQYELKRLGDLLTFQVEENPPLRVQYMYPLNLPPQEFPLSTKYEIHEIDPPVPASDPVCCFDADSSRAFRIDRLRRSRL